MVDILNSRFEIHNENILTTDLFKQWVFFTDLHEEYTVFNENHLLGLLLARCKAKFEPVNVRLGDVIDNFVNSSKKTEELTLRQFRDAVEDLQSHWNTYFECEHVIDLVNGLFTRFGSLNLAPQTNLDDICNVDPTCAYRMSNEAIRRFTVIFCIFFRHIYLDLDCITVPHKHTDFEIENYHRQAGLDAFYEHAMYSDLCPAARITYKQDFAGMYHSIPQVIYFHFPDYVRKKQISLIDIRKGAQHLHCLSVALELKPDILVKFEDEIFPKAWHWILLPGGKVYLRNPEQQTFTADNLWTLLRMIV